MTQQLRVTRKVDFTGAVKVGFGGLPHLAGGKVLYVNGTSWGNGSNSYDGTDPNYPLYDIDTALAKCTDNKMDYIFVLDYWDNDTFPITLDVDTVKVIGLGSNCGPSSWCMINSDGDACLSVGGEVGIEVAGFEFLPGSSDPCILVTTTEGCLHVHHCTFANMGTCQDGISCPSGGELSICTIEDNFFGKGIDRDGMRLYSPSWSTIRNNIFFQYDEIGININGPSAAALGCILDNRFFSDTAITKGGAITIASATGGLIDGNHAMEDGANPGENPYLDTSGPANGWGLNYSGDAVAYPATS